MHNYHADLVLKIDLVLLGVLIAVSFAIVIIAIVNEYLWKKRARSLLEIKKNVYELMLSGKKSDSKACQALTSEITSRQFLDAMSNRDREAVFFNEAEQNIIRSCFISSQRIAKMENIALKSFNKWRHIEAIMSLGYAQSESALKAFKKTINDRDPDVVYFSIIALGQIRTVSSAIILLDCLKRNWAYRYKIVSILESFPVDVADEAIKFVDDSDSQVRLWIVRLISKFKAERHLKRIEEMSNDNSADVRAAVCDCLGAFGKKEAEDTLVKATGDDFWMVRARAVEALSKALGKDCIHHIISRINDASLSVIESVKKVMIEHVESALPYIDKFLSGEDEVAKRVSVEALETSGYMVKVLQKILTGPEDEKRYMLRILKNMIQSHAHLGLEGVLADLPEEERKKILRIIGETDKALAEHMENRITGQAGEPWQA